MLILLYLYPLRFFGPTKAFMGIFPLFSILLRHYTSDMSFLTSHSQGVPFRL